MQKQKLLKPLLLSLCVGGIYSYLVYIVSVLIMAILIAWTLFFVFPILALILLYHLYRKNRHAQFTTILVAVSIVIGSLLGSTVLRYNEKRYWDTTGAVNLERGNIIITAVRAYEKENGNFPEKLTQLVPKYLDSVPQTVSGTNFGYGRSQSASNCAGAPKSDGTFAPGMCTPGKWSFHMRFPGYAFHMCYEFGYDSTSTGSTEVPWGMCDVL